MTTTSSHISAAFTGGLGFVLLLLAWTLLISDLLGNPRVGDGSHADPRAPSTPEQCPLTCRVKARRRWERTRSSRPLRPSARRVTVISGVSRYMHGTAGSPQVAAF